MTRTLRQLIPDLRAPVLRLLTEQSLLRGAAFHWAAELTVPPLARGLRDTVRR